MKTKSITMTPDETDIYDEGTEQEQRDLLGALRERARALGTCDGIVADVVQ